MLEDIICSNPSIKYSAGFRFTGGTVIKTQYFERQNLWSDENPRTKLRIFRSFSQNNRTEKFQLQSSLKFYVFSRFWIKIIRYFRYLVCWWINRTLINLQDLANK